MTFSRRLLAVAVVFAAMLAMPAPAVALNRSPARVLAVRAVHQRCGSYFYRCLGMHLAWLHGPFGNHVHRPQWFFMGYTYEEYRSRGIFARAHSAGVLPQFKTCVVSAGLTPYGRYYGPKKSCLAGIDA